MAEKQAPAVALISIHPRFANAILDGSKHVEFRKVAFKRPVTHVLIYATAPVQQVVGYFEVAGIDARSPLSLWRRYHRVAGIDREEFFAYFKDKRIGFALNVRGPTRLLRPLLLSEIHDTPPPQSFIYSNVDVFSRVVKMAKAA